MDESAAPPVRTLIVDDEQLARQRLHDLLVDRDDIDVVGEAADGPSAVETIRSTKPDLVFLDVQMPSSSGLDVIRTIGPDTMPVTVFVTAYDEYALDAFDLAAIDYLLKPFDDERFEQALDRARTYIEADRADVMSHRLAQLLDHHEQAQETNEAPGTYLERIAVQKRGQVRIVPVDAITHITADGSYAELHTADGMHLIREQLQTLDERLDPAEFYRIHRSTIVRLDEVEVIHRGGGGNYGVQLRDGTRLSVSRSRVDELETRLEIGPV